MTGKPLASVNTPARAEHHRCSNTAAPLRGTDANHNPTRQPTVHSRHTTRHTPCARTHTPDMMWWPQGKRKKRKTSPPPPPPTTTSSKYNHPHAARQTQRMRWPGQPKQQRQQHMLFNR